MASTVSRAASPCHAHAERHGILCTTCTGSQPRQTGVLQLVPHISAPEDSPPAGRQGDELRRINQRRDPFRWR
jgi:hypothetical protein